MFRSVSYYRGSVSTLLRLSGHFRCKKAINISVLNSCFPSSSVFYHNKCLSTATAAEIDSSGSSEHTIGPPTRRKFKAETQKLLDIVAKSLYSEKEVFIRELISNASDAVERLRLLRVMQQAGHGSGHSPEIHIKTDESKKLLIIQDTGIGMSKEEMEENLGIIARSGSRDFVSKLEKNHDAVGADIIGQFGVGFYASFMVADKVEVFSCLHGDSSDSVGNGYYWASSGHDGEFELREAEGVTPGTKIILHLKSTAAEFSHDEVVERILRKYSNFISTPIFLNGRQINTLEPTWTRDPSKVTGDEHRVFYQYLCGNTYDSPRYTLMYKTDAPINLRVLLYVPELKPNIFDVTRETNTGIALYSRKVLIMNRTDVVLPKWLRFFRGVVDSEDIPLNLSRELLQDSSLINRIRRLLTSKVLRFLSQQASRDANKFSSFLTDFGFYLKEGLVTETDQATREEIARLLRWESSGLPAGQTTTLEEYASRMPAGGRTIYFLSVPNRHLAEQSPYLEAVRKKTPNAEVLFLYEPYDELVLMQLNEYDRKSLRSIESLVAEDAADTDSVGPSRPNCLTQEEATHLMQWAEKILGPKVKKVKVTQRLTSHACFVSVREAGAMRHFLRTSLADKPAEERLRVIEPTLELNPEHELVRYLYSLVSTAADIVSESTNKEQLAEALIQHLYDDAMAQAGLLEDVRGFASRMTTLVTDLVRNQQQSPLR